MPRPYALYFPAFALTLGAAALCSTGCDSGTTDRGATRPAETGGHGHGHGHGEFALGTVEVEGRAVTVMLTGDLAPSKTYPHCHLSVTGDAVDVMRIWIGSPSGEDALKARVSGLDNGHPVVDLETPADLDGAVLGIEIEVGGETYTATTSLEHAGGEDGHDDHDHDHDHDGHSHKG